MGDVIVGLVAVLVIIGGATGLTALRQRQLAVRHAPVSALSEHQDHEALRRARDYHRVAQEAVRVLERLQQRDGLVPFLQSAEATSIEATIKKFYELD